MNTTQLECFLAVADNLNFARAAEQLHITQPAVTHQISSLESELNVKLFRRSTRIVELTNAGWTFLADARDIIGKTRAAKARLADSSFSESAPLGIGFSNPLVVERLLGDILGKLRHFDSDVRPLLKHLTDSLLQTQLSEEELHVIFGFSSSDKKNRTESFVPLTKAPVSCVVSPEHPLASRESLSLEDLWSGPMVICQAWPSMPEIASPISSLISRRPPSEVFPTHDYLCAEALIRAGCGFILMPDIALLRSPRLVYIPVRKLPTPYFGMYYKSIRSHPSLPAFIRCARSFMAEQTP
ncbi:MAG TPA: LysR family transcriptional regulator [Candidatus Limivivens intestinipullorum]|uniref:LysR family transcriptional regulator n=1 Tax=Candidatus Limivivens intestinipullorum TaxID=2840858 RepID=A0A9D1JJS1_9FIRM|nr:LysR family transcriptional regulator [Candidatus Limivivens intestinipullorum]